MLTLPRNPGRATARAFWITISVLAGVVIGFMSWQVGLAAAVVMAGLGFLAPPVVDLSYRIWNRGARLLGAGGKTIVVWVLFYGVITPLRIGGSRLSRGRSGEPNARWVRRGTLEAESYAALHQLSGGPAEGGPGRSLASWAVRQRDLRMLLVIPFLMLLSALSEEEAADAPANIYTLF